MPREEFYGAHMVQVAEVISLKGAPAEKDAEASPMFSSARFIVVRSFARRSVTTSSSVGTYVPL